MEEGASGHERLHACAVEIGTPDVTGGLRPVDLAGSGVDRDSTRRVEAREHYLVAGAVESPQNRFRALVGPVDLVSGSIERDTHGTYAADKRGRSSIERRTLHAVERRAGRAPVDWFRRPPSALARWLAGALQRHDSRSIGIRALNPGLVEVAGVRIRPIEPRGRYERRRGYGRHRGAEQRGSRRARTARRC